MVNIQRVAVLVSGDFTAPYKSKVIDILWQGLKNTMRCTDIEHKGPFDTFNIFLNN